MKGVPEDSDKRVPMSGDTVKQQIREILTVITKVSKGDYDVRLDRAGTHPDLAPIISGLNMMISEIRVRETDLEEQREEIKTLNESLLQRINEKNQAEDLYRTLTENSTTGIYITQKGKFIFVNDVFQQYSGYEHNELMSMNSVDLIHPEDKPDVRAKAIEMLKGERTEGYELRMMRKDGSVIWAIENLKSIIFNDEPAVLGNFVNITERKRTEDALVLSDTILKTIHEGIISLDLDFKITYWNTISEEMFGITAAEAKGHFIGDLIQIGQEYDSQNEDRLKALEKGYNREEQLYFTPKGEIWVDVKMRAIEQNGTRTGWVTLVSDISERKRMEMLIRENEEKYATVFRDNPLPMVVFSPETGKIVDVNKAFERINDYTREEVIGERVEKIDNFINPLQNEEMKQLLKKEGRIDNFEAEVKTRTGNIHNVLLSSRMIMLGGDKYLITASNDVTEQKTIEKQLIATNAKLDAQNLKLKAQSQLLMEQTEELVEKNKEVERANQMKSEFLASMSHELRTPLNAVIGFSELMLDGVTGEITDEQKECLSDILSSGKHLLDLINDVLDLSKVEVGKMEFKPVELSVSEVVTDAVQTVRSLTDQKEHRVTVQIEEGINPIYADKGRLKQVLLNLLSNAIKFTPQKGELVITAASMGSMCRIGVRDNGIGIKKEDQEKIFEVFTQAEAISDETPKGTGLGLTLTRQFLLAMGGNVWVESEYGKGSVFYLTIPFTAGDKEKQPETTRESSGTEAVFETKAGGMKTVLIIDDDSKARHLTGSWLKEEGFAIQEASNGEEGLQKARQLLPDLIVLDILMPEKDGWYVLKELKSKEETRAIPVIIVSGAGEKDVAFSLGAIDYFNKPVDKERFRERIRGLGLHQTDSVLVVDDNPADMRLVTSILENEKIKVMKATGGKTALDIMLRSKPRLVILDIMMPDMTGFDVIEKMREIEGFSDIPIIVITSKDFTEDEKEYLARQTERILYKTALNRHDFTDDVQKILRKGKQAAGEKGNNG
jgi:PAS domain S-box-containing protein